jgi:hypothetical protein
MYRLDRKTLLRLTLAALALAGWLPRAAADPIITVYPSVAPNKFLSPSWDGYVANTANIAGTGGLQNGGTATGNPALPAFYSTTNAISTANMIVTDFPSWHGFADPGAVFGPAFANEFGNRLTFGLAIAGNGSTFTMSQVNFDIEPSNPALKPFLSFSGNLGGIVYGPGTVNTVVGRTPAGNLVVDPAATDALTDLWYVGPGVAFEVDASDPGATLQDKINNTLLDPLLQPPNAPFDVTGTFTLGPSLSGSATVAVSPSGPLVASVPEPATALLFGLGVAAAGVAARWRRRREAIT